MSSREVQVHEIREVLRLWLRGEGQRSIARLESLDRKTVRRYVDAAVAAGLSREAAEDQLSDELIASVCETVQPHRPNGHGAAWAVLQANHDQLKTWLVDEDLTAVKAHELLGRRGVMVPERTLHRYALEVLGVGRPARGTTVRVADGEPGSELQVDFGKLGLVADRDSAKRRVCWALIFTACYSRHCFVWLSFRQSTEAVIAGCEAAWSFFGVFKVLVPENVPRNIFGEAIGGTAPKPAQGGVDAGHHGGQGLVPDGDHHPEPAPGQPGAEQLRGHAAHHRAGAEVPLEPQSGLGHPGTVDSPVAGDPGLAGDRHCPARGALRAHIAQGNELFVGHVGADLALAGLHPLLELGKEGVDELTAVRGRDAQLTSVSSGHPVGHGVVVAAGQLAGTSVAVGQVEGSSISMISSACFMWSLLGAWRLDTPSEPRRGRPPVDAGESADRCWGDLMAMDGEL